MKIEHKVFEADSTPRAGEKARRWIAENPVVEPIRLDFERGRVTVSFCRRRADDDT